MAYIEKTCPTTNFPKGGWKASYRGPDGKERSKTRRTKAEAETWLATEQADRSRGVYVDPAAGRITLAAYADQWMTVQPWRQSTRDSTLSGLRRILPTFGDRPLRSLRTSEMQAWAIGLEARLAPSTVEGTVRLLKAILRAAELDQLIPRSPAEGVRLRRQEGSMLVPLSVAEVRQLADAARPELRAAVVLTACTGLRQGELFGLTADRVAWLKRELVINRQLVTPTKDVPALGPCKTSRSVRTVPVADHALEVLAGHVERFGPGPGGLVFHRTGRSTPSWPRSRAAEAFGPACRQGGRRGVRVARPTPPRSQRPYRPGARRNRCGRHSGALAGGVPGHLRGLVAERARADPGGCGAGVGSAEHPGGSAMKDVDPAQLPWSPERLGGLAETLLEELQAQDLHPDAPVLRAAATAIARWVWVRASALTSLDVVDALNNALSPPHLELGGPADSALRSAASSRPGEAGSG